MKLTILLGVVLLPAAVALAQAVAPAAGAGKPALPLSDFQDKADLEKWSPGDSGNVQLSLAPRAATDSNILLKVVLNGGDYPGIALKGPPKDWSAYEALRFAVVTDSPFALSIRIDDGKSTDYKTRFNKTFRLEPGRNVLQLPVADVARVLNVKDIRGLMFFGSRPPAGLTLWFDDIALGELADEQVPFIPYEKRKDLQPRLDVVTPHIPFAKPLPGGPLKAFIMSGITCRREVAEMMQRIDLKVSLQTWDVNWDQNTWGMGDFYSQRGHAFDRDLMQRYFTSSMQGPEKFDVIVLPTPIGWNNFPRAGRAALLKRVKEGGEGLLLIHPFPGDDKGWPEDLKELSPLVDCVSDTIHPGSGYVQFDKTARITGKKWVATYEPAFMLKAVPLEALPFEKMSHVKYKLADGAKVLLASEDGDPILAVKTVGKGKVLTAAWIGSMITPQVDRGGGEGPTRPYRYQEVLYDLIARAMLAASPRDLRPPPTTAPALTPVDTPFSDPCLKAETTGLPTPGQWRLVFTPPGQTGVAEVKLTAPAAVKRGAEIGLSFSVPPEAVKVTDWSLVLGERVNGQWRTLDRQALDLAKLPTRADGVYLVSAASARVRQPVAVVRVEAKDAGKIVALGEAEVVVTPPGAAWDDYEVFMWPVDGLPFLREFEDSLILQSSSSGVMDTAWNSHGRLMRWARAGLRILPHAVDGRPLHIRPYEFAAITKAWNETKDKKHLIRPSSFADPEFLKGLDQRMTAAAELLAPFHIPAYVLCDEPSITSYREEFDFDWHPANIELFRKVLKDKFKTIENVSAALGKKFESFEKIEAPTTDEARKSGNWGLWSEWRAHNDTVMAEGYRRYRDTFRKVDPRAAISISGTQTYNPFDGFDWVKLSPLFDSMCGYGYGEQERTRLSFYNGLMLNATPAGYGNTGKGVQYQLWQQLANHGCGHVLFWWVSFRNPDLTWCKSAVDYRKGFDELRGGLGKQYMQGRRLLSPVAVHYSPLAMRAAWTAGKGGEHAAALQAMTDAAVAAGYDPVFVSDEQIAGGELGKRGIKAVLLPMPLALGRGDKAGGVDVAGGLAAFAKAGGPIVASEMPTLDEFLQPAKLDAELAGAMLKFDDIKGDLAASLAKAGAKPWVKVARPDGSAVPGLSITMHKLGQAEAYIVTLLRRPVGQKEVVGADGVVTYQPDPKGGNAVEKCVVDVSALVAKAGGPLVASLPRAGKFVDLKDNKLELDVPDGDGLPIALLPYKLDVPDGDGLPLVRPGSEYIAVLPYKPGPPAVTIEAKVGTLVVHCAARRDTSAIAVPHVIHVEVLDEKGQAMPGMSHNLVDFGGKTNIDLPLAIEDAGKNVTVRVKDILTGQTAEKQVKLP